MHLMSLSGETVSKQRPLDEGTTLKISILCFPGQNGRMPASRVYQPNTPIRVTRTDDSNWSKSREMISMYDVGARACCQAKTTDA